ncbi:hypothetical protein L596_017644 [Steinernema carpocapsae]|uniref:Uncharacterized protein n=1 Tax=Steinernema carpocapsae TaxID=34508 RepID=A0A4U5N2M8_STECR|nr:hypothetical protein L596_017644 [Steinernema carpocapsae]
MHLKHLDRNIRIGHTGDITIKEHISVSQPNINGNLNTQEIHCLSRRLTTDVFSAWTMALGSEFQTNTTAVEKYSFGLLLLRVTGRIL